MLIVILVLFLNIALILFPNTAMSAARDGLKLWLDNILPALLPFAVGVNVLSGVGFTRFLGVLLEPVMQPLFRVPGAGGFALVTGLVSGSPLGAKVTADMRAEGLLTKREARRLAGFANCCGPLFVIGVVGVGLFKDAAAGYFLYIVHLLGALAVGFVFRGFGKSGRTGGGKRILGRAGLEMSYGREKNGSIGLILGTSVMNAMETMLLIGGYVMLFSVIIGIFRETGLFGVFAGIIPWDVPEGAAIGFIEMTSGVKSLGAGQEQFKKALITAAGVISWGGLCIHAQSLGFIGKTDIGALPYLAGKMLHAAFAVGLAVLLYPLYTGLNGRALPAGFFSPSSAGIMKPALDGLKTSLSLFAVSVALLTVFALIIYVAAKKRGKRPNPHV